MTVWLSVGAPGQIWFSFFGIRAATGSPRPPGAPVAFYSASPVPLPHISLAQNAAPQCAAHRQKVDISEDDGAQVQIATGLQPGQGIIVSPPADLADGTKVKPAPQKPISEAER